MYLHLEQCRSTSQQTLVGVTLQQALLLPFHSQWLQLTQYADNLVTQMQLLTEGMLREYFSTEVLPCFFFKGCCYYAQRALSPLDNPKTWFQGSNCSNSRVQSCFSCCYSPPLDYKPCGHLCDPSDAVFIQCSKTIKMPNAVGSISSSSHSSSSSSPSLHPPPFSPSSSPSAHPPPLLLILLPSPHFPHPSHSPPTPLHPPPPLSSFFFSPPSSEWYDYLA